MLLSGQRFVRFVGSFALILAIVWYTYVYTSVPSAAVSLKNHFINGEEELEVGQTRTVVTTITDKVVATSTVTHVVTKVPAGGSMSTATVTSFARIRPAKPIPATTTINREFERYRGMVEEYQKVLSVQDKELLQQLTSTSTRQNRLKRMYELDGAEEWLQFVLDNDDSAMPPLTKFAQQYIYDRQHPNPASCKDKQFLVLNTNWDLNGLGTVVHGTGWVLGLALRLNRILVYNDAGAPGENFVEPGCGRTRSLDCIFESFSSCTSGDATPENSIYVENYWKVPKSIWPERSTSAVPPVLGEALRRQFSDMHEDAIKYWWRTQAAAYMMRMNGPAMARLRELRFDPVMQRANTIDPKTGGTMNVPVPFPLPDGSFSMHVRHGDKGIEMELIPFKDFVDRAEEHAAMNMIMSRKVCFISTEDAGVIEEAKIIGNAWISSNTTSNQNWTWIYSDIPRINGGPKEQLDAFGNRTDMTIKWMQQLFFAIEAPYIVGTRGSGWNRMIDELRCVWLDCRTPYMEVGPFEDWVHYNF
ncbi:hypothetical protein YB2330_003580 [Saitoella coloradoensis]